MIFTLRSIVYINWACILYIFAKFGSLSVTKMIVVEYEVIYSVAATIVPGNLVVK